MAESDAFFDDEYTIFFISSWDVSNSEKTWNDVLKLSDKLRVVIHVPLSSETCKFYDRVSSCCPNLKCIDDKKVATRLLNRFHVFQLPCSIVVNSIGKTEEIMYMNMPTAEMNVVENVYEEQLFREAIEAFNNFQLYEAAVKCVIIEFYNY